MRELFKKALETDKETLKQAFKEGAGVFPYCFHSLSQRLKMYFLKHSFHFLNPLSYGSAMLLFGHFNHGAPGCISVPLGRHP